MGVSGRLTFCGRADGLAVRHGERDRSHGTVMWGGSQDWGEVAWNLSHLTTAVRLQVGGWTNGGKKSFYILFQTKNLFFPDLKDVHDKHVEWFHLFLEFISFFCLVR